MSLEEEYRKQQRWRDWQSILEALPSLTGARVLDLGCGAGEVAARLVARGARVTGVDGNEALLAAARQKRLEGAEFLHDELRNLELVAGAFDGIWCSFAAAYLPDLTTALEVWKRRLRPGGWIALTEVDDLFGHEPLSQETTDLFASYEKEALAAGRYDFHMGGKLAEHLAQSGFSVARCFTVGDRELAFDGPASPEVLEAWRARLARMQRLRAHCGAAIDRVEGELLDCLARPDHRSRARVRCCVAGRTD